MFKKISRFFREVTILIGLALEFAIILQILKVNNRYINPAFFIFIILFGIFCLFKKKIRFLNKLIYILESVFVQFLVINIVLNIGDWSYSVLISTLFSILLIVVLFSIKDKINCVATSSLFLNIYFLIVAFFSFSISAIFNSVCVYWIIFIVSSVIVIPLILFFIFRGQFHSLLSRWKKWIINKYFLLDLITSCISIFFVVVYIMYKFNSKFTELTALGVVAIVALLVLMLYITEIKMFADRVAIMIFVTLTITPIILFILMSQKNVIGNYNGLKICFAVLTGFITILVTSMSDTMKLYVGINEQKSKVLNSKLAKYKLLMTNITILNVLVVGCFYEEGEIRKFINWTSSLFSKINLITNINLKMSIKWLIFIGSIIIFIAIASWIMIKFEKWIFMKLL